MLRPSSLAAAILLSLALLPATALTADRSDPVAPARAPGAEPATLYCLVPSTHVCPPDVVALHERAESSFEYCGDVEAIFLNPDLQVQQDGLIHDATGWFFGQFQIIADDPSFTVDRLAFHFGKPIPDALRSCDTPKWITDAYYENYRVDDDPSDGFFIPINTTNVPDGEWAAAISVFKGGTEVGRGYTRATVTNGCMVRFGADCTRASTIPNDKIRPWPIVLPGDGVQIHGIQGLTLEFAEPLMKDTVRATVNGVDVPLTEMEPRLWDTDLFAAPLDEDSPACPAQMCTDTKWGPAFQWQGEIPEGAVISVTARDLNDNPTSKILHISSTAVGGIISVQLPKLEVKIVDAQKFSGVGETAEFKVNFINVGRDAAHTNLQVQAAPEVELVWQPNHIVVESGEEVTATLRAKSNEAGTYSINAWAEYKAADQDLKTEIPLTLVVGEGGEVKGPDAQPEEPLETTEADATAAENESPGLGALVAFGVLGTAALALRRRRD